MSSRPKLVISAYICTLITLFCAASYFITGWAFPLDIDLAYGVLAFVTILVAVASILRATLQRKFRRYLIPVLTLVFIVIVFCMAANLYDRKYWLRTEDGGPTGANGTCLFWSGKATLYHYSGSYGVFNGRNKFGDPTNNPANPQDDVLCVALQTPSLLAIRLNPSYGAYGSYNKTHLTTYAFLVSSLLLATYGMYMQSRVVHSRKN